MTTTNRSGGKILVDALLKHGVDRAFGVPGESYLAVLDALHDVANQLSFVVCRQEGGAAYMAEAYGKLTGKPGICFVTRGPGAANASIGIHTAQQDSTPMILFVGQVARDQIYREAFQEVDYQQFFGNTAKWVVQIEDARRIPELVSQAFHRAVNGRPGPVVVVLPEDMLTDVVAISDAPAYRRVPMYAGQEQLNELMAMLSSSERPLMIVGGGGWTAQAVGDIRKFACSNGLPVAASFRCQDLFDNAHPNYAGDLGLSAGAELQKSMRNSDLLVVVGARLGEMTTAGYSLVDIPVPTQRLIHVHPGAEELGRVYRPTLAINASPEAFAGQVALLPERRSPERDAWVRTLHENYLRNLEHSPNPGAVQMGEIMRWLRENLTQNAILTTGAGNYSGWVHRFYQYRNFRTQLGPTNGSMGYGVPAAIAAKLTHPDRDVVSFSGDGCFLMNGQELATAMKYDARVIFLVVNNGMYGTIRMHQERHYPERVTATDLSNPDFAMLARSYGLHAETVEETQQFEGAFRRSRDSGKPALIEMRIDPEALTTSMTLSQIRTKAKAGTA